MNEKIIWDYVYNWCKNPYGTAAIMGNLMAESSLNPKSVTGIKDPDYTEKADLGMLDFVHDKHAYGLVQWYYWSRKQGLYQYAKSTCVSVGNLYMQLEYMCKEINNSYKSVYKAVTEATDIRTASDIVMLKYEKPGTITESAKQKRANYGQKYFDMFYSEPEPSPEPEPIPVVTKKYVKATANVNIRTGDATSFTRLGKLLKDNTLEYVATSVTGWYAVRYNGKVAWISNEFSEIVNASTYSAS